MGYGIVPDIKDENVVCQKPCEHKDCAANRDEWMLSYCSYCKQPMLPGKNFFYDLVEGEPMPNAAERSKRHIHAGCLFDKIESERVSSK